MIHAVLVSPFIHKQKTTVPVPLEMDCGALQADKDMDIPDVGI